MTNDYSRRIIERNGLPVDIEKQQNWQRRGAANYAEKRRRKHQARLTTKIQTATATATAKNDWPTRTRKLAHARSGGMCEVCATTRASQLHHRKLRRFGDHRIVNALHVCDRCHEIIHGRTRAVSLTASKIHGWLVPESADPAKVSVLLAGDERVYLTADGHYEDAA